MCIWYKQGVYGELTPETAEGLRKTERLYANGGDDVYVTSIRDSSHGPGSFHPHGRAWDMRPGKISREELQSYLGAKFQVIDESNHRHVEYDPK